MEMPHNVERVSYDDMTLEQFREKYEKARQPVIITDCIKEFETDFNFSFKVKSITVENNPKNLYTEFGSKHMKIAETDGGRKIKIELQK
jgi:hypothetical protein